MDFFSDVRNLDSCTPAFFSIVLLEGAPGPVGDPEILGLPGRLRVPGLPLYQGQRFRYRFRILGIPIPWTTRIEEVGPQGFVDVQEAGPYRSFCHTHVFQEIPRGVLMVDTVDYQLPFGPLDRLADALVVRPLLRKIFTHRAALAAQRFGSVEDAG